MENKEDIKYIECKICYTDKWENDFFITKCNHKWCNDCNENMKIYHLCPFCKTEYKPKCFGYWCKDDEGFHTFVELTNSFQVINDPVVRRQLRNLRRERARRLELRRRREAVNEFQAAVTNSCCILQ